jgi:hypothetical protein
MWNRRIRAWTVSGPASANPESDDVLWTLVDGLLHPGQRDGPIRKVSSVELAPLCRTPNANIRAERPVDLGLHDPFLPVMGDIEQHRAAKLRKTQLTVAASHKVPDAHS